mmetsp:Transcript_17893/g.38355  ORF Transcript_17893/g.38355 Transcript_17893/m.38355 type:complete len:200 (-) Transcript_17893:924-1523(-)
MCGSFAPTVVQRTHFRVSVSLAQLLQPLHSHVLSSLGGPPTGEPRIDGLEVVVRHLGRVRARRCVASVVRKHLHAVDLLDLQLFHAHLHEEVLSPALPVQLVLAPLAVCLVHPQGITGEDLEGAEELKGPGLAVPGSVAVPDKHRGPVHVSRPVVVVQLHLQAVREEDSIRVDFNDPLVLPPSVLGEDHLPSFHEGKSV